MSTSTWCRRCCRRDCARGRWRSRRWCVTIAMIAVMLYYGYDIWHFAWARGWKSDTVWAVPLWIPYLSIPLGFGLLLLQLSPICG